LRRILAILSCLMILVPAVAEARGGGGGRSGASSGSHSGVSVRGHSRKDGTYVRPHQRRLPGHSSHYASAPPTPRYLMTAPGARDIHGRLVRSESEKREFMRETGYSHGRPGYVVDHVVPLKRGGCDCPANMQWQTMAEAKAKDKWE
jgi:hypothetical protein